MVHMPFCSSDACRTSSRTCRSPSESSEPRLIFRSSGAFAATSDDLECPISSVSRLIRRSSPWCSRRTRISTSRASNSLFMAASLSDRSNHRFPFILVLPNLLPNLLPQLAQLSFQFIRNPAFSPVPTRYQATPADFSPWPAIPPTQQQAADSTVHPQLDFELVMRRESLLFMEHHLAPADERRNAVIAGVAYHKTRPSTSLCLRPRGKAHIVGLMDLQQIVLRV